MSETTVTLTEPETFADADVSLELRRHPQCKVEVIATVSPAFSQQAERVALEKVGKTISIPGFRKGKLPAELVRKNFADKVQEAWRSAIVQQLIHRIIALSQCAPYDASAKIEYAIKECSIQEGGKIVVTFEAGPSFEDLDPSRFEVPSCEITEEVRHTLYERGLRAIQLFFAEWHPVEGRPLAEGDFVDLDVEVLPEPSEEAAEEAATEQKLFEERRIAVDDTMPSWMRDVLLGLEVGQSVETTSALDERASEEQRQDFLPRRLRLTIRGIHQADTSGSQQKMFETGQVASEEEMEKSLRDQVENTLHMTREQQREEAIRSQVRTLWTADMPESLLLQEMRLLMSNRLQALSPEQRQQLSQEEIQEMFQSFRPRAESNIRLMMFGRRLLQQKQIEMNEESLRAMLQHNLAQYVRGHGEPKKEEMEAVIDRLRSITFAQALIRGAVLHIQSHATEVARPLSLPV